jgi:hypothetical protein
VGRHRARHSLALVAAEAAAVEEAVFSAGSADSVRASLFVVARLDRAIQQPQEDVLLISAGGYWMPAFAGMTWDSLI